MNRFIVSSFAKKIFTVFLRLLLILLVLIPVYFFYQPQISIFDVTINNPFYKYIESLEVWLYLILYFSIVSFINIFILFSLSIYFDYKKEKAAKMRERYEKFFAERLTEYLLFEKYNDENKTDEFVKSIKQFTKKRIQIDAIFSTYTKIQETLALDLSEKFKLVLKKLGIYNKQKLFLYSNNNDERIIAMKMLSYLRIQDHKERITYYSKSKNHALRTEAYAALIRLMEKDDVLTAFIKQKHDLSLLDINVVINAVLKNFKTKIDYESLLNSTLLRKTIIGSLLVKYRNLNQYNKLLLNHIKNGNSNIKGNHYILLRNIVWDAFLETADENVALEAITSHLNIEPDEVKQVILEKSYKIKDKRLTELISNIIESLTLINKVEALKILFNTDVNRFIDFKYSENKETVKAFNEVSDININ